MSILSPRLARGLFLLFFALTSAVAQAAGLQIAAPAALRGLATKLAAALPETGSGAAETRALTAPLPKDVDVVLTTDPRELDRALPSEQAGTALGFASDAMVLAYAPEGPLARAAAAGTPWFETLAANPFSFGRGDPDRSLLGLRSMLVLQLAGEHYEDPNLAIAILRPGQAMPTEVLLRRLQSSTLDAALVYRALATQAGVPYLALPAPINLGDPGRGDDYAAASVDLDGRVTRGAPIVLLAAARDEAPHPEAKVLLDFLASGAGKKLVEAEGYVVPPDLPAKRSRSSASAMAGATANEIDRSEN